MQQQAKSKGIGAALGLLGGLVQTARERARRTEQAAEQRAARKEELLDAQMKSLTAKPQEWKAAAQAYLTQKALDAFRAQEREGYHAAAGQAKSPWQRVWEGITMTVQNVANTASSAVAGILSPQKTGSYKLAAPALQDDGPGPFDRIIESIKNWWQEQKKKSNFFHNAKGQDLVGPPTNDPMDTYIAAAINVQRTGTNWGGDESGKGPAQLSHQQLDTPYGEGFDCKNGECRGYGLGLPGADPYDAVVAVEGMQRRIQQVMEEAERLGEKNGITLDETDKFIIAAMSQNGGGFDLNDITIVMNKFTKDGTIDWQAYFQDKQDAWEDKINEANWWNPKDWDLFINNARTGGVDYDTKFILEKFYIEVDALQEEGYYHPEKLDTQKIEDLIEGNSIDGDEK